MRKFIGDDRKVPVQPLTETISKRYTKGTFFNIYQISLDGNVFFCILRA